MSTLSIRDLQKISGKAISELPGLTAIKSGSQVVGLLTPIRKPDLDRLRAVLERADALAKERDPNADDEALKEFGDVDPTNWNEEAVRDVRREDM